MTGLAQAVQPLADNPLPPSLEGFTVPGIVMLTMAIVEGVKRSFKGVPFLKDVPLPVYTLVMAVALTAAARGLDLLDGPWKVVLYEALYLGAAASGLWNMLRERKISPSNSAAPPTSPPPGPPKAAIGIVAALFVATLGGCAAFDKPPDQLWLDRRADLTAANKVFIAIEPTLDDEERVSIGSSLQLAREHLDAAKLLLDANNTGSAFDRSLDFSEAVLTAIIQLREPDNGIRTERSVGDPTPDQGAQGHHRGGGDEVPPTRTLHARAGG